MSLKFSKTVGSAVLLTKPFTGTVVRIDENIKNAKITVDNFFNL